MPDLDEIQHSRPTVDDRDRAAVAEVLRSGWIAQGAKVAEFEQAFAVRVGVRGGVATSSGTAALTVALRVLGVAGGDEVLIPTYACAALLQAVRAAGAIPRLVDCDPFTLNMDVEAARRARSPRARAIIVVHSFGLPADLEELRALGLPLVEDAAHAIGAVYRGRPVGGFGDASVVSFYATKLLTTGEGGMLLSNAKAVLDAARDCRDYDEKSTDRPRFNYKLTDFQAALGLAQLARLPAFLERRDQIAHRYSEALRPAPVELPASATDRRRVHFRYVVKGAGPAEHYLAALQGAGVHARRPIFRPLHRYVGAGGFPGADEAWARAVSLPMYPSLSDAEVMRVADAAARAFQ